MNAAEANPAAHGLAESGLATTEREGLPMADEKELAQATKREQKAAVPEKAPEPLPKGIKTWDEGEAAPVCDLETGKCTS